MQKLQAAQAKQRAVAARAKPEAMLPPKKKTKVLSRKKYGSDHSSNSPPHV